MRQVSRTSANYAADLAGVNSVLYELGGLIVMHDASGCNSTYATHDEPRWYDAQSLIYISGLTEYDAVLGNDEQLIEDIVEAAKETHPRFIAIFGSPIALVIGTDFKGIAHLIEQRTGIPTFGFKTSGMKSYIDGARQALSGLAQRYCIENKQMHSDALRVNLLGVTPLDFGMTGNVDALFDFCDRHHFIVQSSWAMTTTLEQITNAPCADVNWVVSSMGIEAAEILKKKFGIPYVVGLPIGRKMDDAMAKRIIQTSIDKTDRYPALGSNGHEIVIIGEPVFASSLRAALSSDRVQIVCPTEVTKGLVMDHDVCSHDEKDIQQAIDQAKMVIADPIYKRLITNDNIECIGIPHIAYSGRLYQEQIPVYIGPDGLDNLFQSG